MKRYNKSYIGSLLGLVPSLILIIFDIWFTLWFNPSIISKHNFDTIGANQAYGWMMLFIHFFAIPICLGVKQYYFCCSDYCCNSMGICRCGIS